MNMEESILDQAENELARHQKKADLNGMWREHAAPAIAEYRKTQAAIRTAIEQADSDMLRLARLNKSIGDIELGPCLAEYRQICGADGQIEQGISWCENLDVEAELGARPRTAREWQIAVERLDHRLGSLCAVGNLAGRITELHTQAMARFADLQQKSARQGISLFNTRANEGELLPKHDDVATDFNDAD
jgi:hypothetical protein